MGVLCAVAENSGLKKKKETRTSKRKVEIVAIANALQLETPRRRAVHIRFNFIARTKFEVVQPTRCHVRAYLQLIRYVTL